MRILHTSDWHIGKNDGEQSLLDDQRYFIDSTFHHQKGYEELIVMIFKDIVMVKFFHPGRGVKKSNY